MHNWFITLLIMDILKFSIRRKINKENKIKKKVINIYNLVI